MRLCLSVTTDKDVFTIQHLSTKMCINVESRDLRMATCDPVSRSQQWKWGSGHRLFHVGTSLCLSLDVLSKTVSLVECNSAILLWWRCLDGTIYTVYEMALVFSNSKLVTKRDTTDNWVRGGSSDNICQKAYRGKCGYFVLSMSASHKYPQQRWTWASYYVIVLHPGIYRVVLLCFVHLHQTGFFTLQQFSALLGEFNSLFARANNKLGQIPD